MKGNFVTQVPAGDNGRGGYLLRVAYKDKGTQQLSSLTSEKIIVLRNPTFNPEKAKLSKGTLLTTTPRRSFSMVGDNSHLGYKGIDLTGIKQIELLVSAQPRTGAAGGIVEVHLDSPEGKLIGQTDLVIPKEVDFGKLMAVANAANSDKKGTPAPPINFNAMRRLLSTQLKATLVPVEGIHDLYFVFKNPKASAHQIIMQMQEIQFQNEIPK